MANGPFEIPEIITGNAFQTLAVARKHCYVRGKMLIAFFFHVKKQALPSKP